MANIYASDYNKKPLSSGNKPQGYNESYKHTLAANAAIGDVIYLGKIPAGVEINSGALTHSADADSSLSIGYIPEGGAAVPEAFLSATALATAGRKNFDKHPVVLNVPSDLIATVSGGVLNSGTVLSVVTAGKGIGVA
jgi:hypothetical protein